MFNASLIGNKSIRENLMSRIHSDSLSGAMLFTGRSSIGKRRIAFELVQRELCTTKSLCGNCQNCLIFSKEPLPTELPNMLRIIPEGKSGTIRIGAIRGNDLVDGGLITWAYRAPLYNYHRWIIIEDAHRLNNISANMLLKIIEEPPQKTHFILITHRPNSLPLTVRSRCEQLAFNILTDYEIWSIAQKCNLKEINKDVWLALSSGTLQYLHQDSFTQVLNKIEAWFNIINGMTFNSNRNAILPNKKLTTNQGEQLRQSLEILLLIIKNIYHYQNKYKIQLTPWLKQIDKINFNHLSINKIQDRIFEAMRSINYNINSETILREISLSFKVK